MWAYNGTEICELVGIVTLLLLREKYIGLYRDNRLSVFRSIIGQDAEKHKKVIHNIFKDKEIQMS